MSTEISTAQRIRCWRAFTGLTQRELARAVGVSQGAVAQWEREASAPRNHLLPRIAAAFGVDLERFWGPLPETEEPRQSA